MLTYQKLPDHIESCLEALRKAGWVQAADLFYSVYVGEVVGGGAQ